MFHNYTDFFHLVSILPEPNLSWYRDDTLIDESNRYYITKESLGMCHLEVRKLEFIDQVSICKIYKRVCVVMQITNVIFLLGRVEMRRNK